MNEDFEISKIKLIVGLGNVGDEFKYSRHNLGFLFLDVLTSKFNLNFKSEKKFFCDLSEFLFNENKIYLLKPLTMMNHSGKSVSAFVNFYKIHASDILVIHDDLDISFGKYLLQYSKGPKVHNGVISIQNSLGTSQFWRLRIGVDCRTDYERRNITGADYVLSKMRDDELIVLENSIAEAILTIFNKTENVSQAISQADQR